MASNCPGSSATAVEGLISGTRTSSASRVMAIAITAVAEEDDPFQAELFFRGYFCFGGHGPILQ